MGFYDFPHSPFDNELAYGRLLKRANLPWNRTTRPLDDEAFDVDAAALSDDEIASVDTSDLETPRPFAATHFNPMVFYKAETSGSNA